MPQGRPSTVRDQLLAATQLAADAQGEPGSLSVLPVALARVEYGERWHPEPLRQRCVGGLRVGAGGVVVAARKRAWPAMISPFSRRARIGSPNPKRRIDCMISLTFFSLGGCGFRGHA